MHIDHRPKKSSSPDKPQRKKSPIKLKYQNGQLTFESLKKIFDLVSKKAAPLYHKLLVENR